VVAFFDDLHNGISYSVVADDAGGISFAGTKSCEDPFVLNFDFYVNYPDAVWLGVMQSQDPPTRGNLYFIATNFTVQIGLIHGAKGLQPGVVKKVDFKAPLTSLSGAGTGSDGSLYMQTSLNSFSVAGTTALPIGVVGSMQRFGHVMTYPSENGKLWGGATVPVIWNTDGPDNGDKTVLVNVNPDGMTLRAFMMDELMGAKITPNVSPSYRYMNGTLLTYAAVRVQSFAVPNIFYLFELDIIGKTSEKGLSRAWLLDFPSQGDDTVFFDHFVYVEQPLESPSPSHQVVSFFGTSPSFDFIVDVDLANQRPASPSRHSIQQIQEASPNQCPILEAGNCYCHLSSRGFQTLKLQSVCGQE
jgi:hypothetical protein